MSVFFSVICVFWAFFAMFLVGMALSEASLSIHDGIWVQPGSLAPVETVVLVQGKGVGCANLTYASRLNKVCFYGWAGGVTIAGEHLQVSPLAVPSAWILVLGTPSPRSLKGSWVVLGSKWVVYDYRAGLQKWECKTMCSILEDKFSCLYITIHHRNWRCLSG